jgi:hypothetical protein
MTDQEIKYIIKDSINAVDSTTYGSKYQDHLLEQYKTYLGMADKISDRRATTNTFFLTLNTTIVSAIGIVGYYDKSKIALNKDYLIILVLGLMTFCFVWYRLIRSYKDLNSAKFLVIHAIEEKLPIQPFKAEWDGLGQGKDPNRYLPFTNIETIVPFAWATMYLIIVFYLLIVK